MNGKYATETVTLPDGTQNEILLRTYEIFPCDHDFGARDVVKPIMRIGYERALGCAAIMRDCGYRRVVINPGVAHTI